MSEWKEYKLEDAIERFIDYRGKTPNKVNSGIPLITAKIVKGGRLLDPNEFISENDYPTWMTRGYPKQNDLILTTEAPLGEVALIKNEKVALAQRVITLQGKKDICNTIFLKYYFQSEDGQQRLISRATGTTVEGIKSSELKKIEILLPPLTEQKSIAEVLSSLDDKIDLLHQQNKTLEALAETLFRQWFDNDNSEWQEMNLGSVVEIVRGLSYKGAGLSDSNDVNAIPMINLNSVNEGGGFKYTGTKYYNGDYKDRHLIIPGDVVITNTEQGHEHRLIGFSAIIPNSIGPKAIFSQHIYKLKPKDTRVTSLFINYLLNYSSLRDQVIGATNGSTVNMLSLEGLEKCKIQLPPKSLITKFEAFAKDIQAKKEVNVDQINQLETLRNNLLPKLMSGAVTVSGQ